jgi:MFS family permease
MTQSRSRPFGQNYAYVVVAVIFVSLLCTAGLRSAPGVLMVPWEKAFGWERETVSLAAAIGLALFGLVGPFAAALMQNLGIRKVMLAALTTMAASCILSLFMTQPWQLIATWGLMSGLGSGCIGAVLSATIVNRWFVKNRGLIMGLLTASTATGTLIFLPGMAWLTEHFGWKTVAITIGVVAAVLIPAVALLLPERPADIGQPPLGGEALVPAAPSAGNPFVLAISTLVLASKKLDFWLLFGAFYVCGFTTNGLIGAHMIALCADHGMPEVKAAGVMAMMGLFDLVGTTASGWLTDRYDSRKLLFAYYALRGLSLFYLPFADFSFYGLALFSVFYGLDWIATVPPTVKLANQTFGEKLAPIVFGWIFAGHQLGAASAAFFAGFVRTYDGAYTRAFITAGAAALLAAAMSLAVARGRRAPPAVATA